MGSDAHQKRPRSPVTDELDPATSVPVGSAFGAANSTAACTNQDEDDDDSPSTPVTHTPKPSSSGQATPVHSRSRSLALTTQQLAALACHDATLEGPPTPSATNHSRRNSPGDFPPEIVALIVSHLYDLLLPPPPAYPSPDPHLHLLPRTERYAPFLFAPTPMEQARECLRNVALVDRTWGEHATKALWTTVGFGMPRAFESVLKTIEEYQSGRRMKSKRNVGGWNGGLLEGRGMDFGEDNKWAKMGAPTGAAESVEGGSNHLEQFMNLDDPLLLSSLLDRPAFPSLSPADSPLLHSKSLSFSRFRTAGLRRSVLQGSMERFVTPHRLLTLLQGTRLSKDSLVVPGNHEQEDESVFSETTSDGDGEEYEWTSKHKGRLEAVGFTEFMDSAISKKVLDELLFRGGFLAEYEERKELSHHLHHSDYLSSSDSEGTIASTSHSHYPHVTSPRPAAAAFVARQLQSSHSRSPSSRPHRPSLSSSMEEEDDGMNDGGDEDEDQDARGRRPPTFAPTTDGRQPYPQPPRMGGRRSSGAGFAPPSELHRDESEERGRARTNRDVLPPPVPRHPPASSTRRGRSLLPPPSAFATRSSSVPAHYLLRQELGLPQIPPPSAAERSSSVPASVRPSHGEKRIVRVLEGSTEVKAIRALDLCGCVSHKFVQALEECIGAYKLGPPGFMAAVRSAAGISMIAESADDSDEDEDDEDDDSSVTTASGTEGGRMAGSVWSNASVVGRGFDVTSKTKRKLRRVFFPHLRRLGLASSLLPTSLLTAFVTSFPYLNHLDLTSTLASPILLKHLAISGQNGPGGRSMRLKSLSLARCRLITGESLLGLLCGDCPPFTSSAGSGAGVDADTEESWGSGEIVQDLVDLSLYGDATYPSPLTPAELKLVLTISPAFTLGYLRTLDLGSTPLTDILLRDSFPPQPHLIELGLANCRGISLAGVAEFLETKARGVEVLDLSNSCPPAFVPRVSTRRGAGAGGAGTLSIMELHTTLLGRVASVSPSSADEGVANELVKRRTTNLRVVELDAKALEAVQGGAGDWRAIWGKGRRGWYVDIGVSSEPTPALSPTATSAPTPSSSTFVPPHHHRPSQSLQRLPRTLVHLSRDFPKRQALQRLADLNGVVSGEIGWHARKMEVLRGDGLMGREDGLYVFHSYQI